MATSASMMEDKCLSSLNIEAWSKGMHDLLGKNTAED